MIEIANLVYTAPRLTFRLRVGQLQLAADQVTVLLGDNGAGKSTLLRLLAGLLIPDSGRLCIDGRAPAGIRADIAFVSGEGSSFADYAPDDYADLDTMFYPRFDRTAYAKLVRFSNLPARDVSRYSQGERLRLGIARALARQPSVLLLDEPFPVLDLRGRDDLLSLLSHFMPDGQHILLATHQLREAEQYADRVVVLGRGSVIADTDMDTIRTCGDNLESWLRQTLGHAESRAWDFFR